MKSTLFITILFLITTAYSQTAVLTGDVQDWEDNAVSGCAVKLLGQGSETTTQANGSFTLSNLGLGVKAPDRAVTRLKSGIVSLTLPGPGDLRILFHSLSGRRTAEVIKKNLSAGTHKVNLKEYLVEGNLSMALIKIETPYFQEYHIVTGSTQHTQPAASLAKPGSQADDTLSISCQGHIPKKVPIDNYNNDLGNIMVRPPNFIIIFLDDSGYGDLSTYGQTAYSTPNLDKMADEGARFNHFYTAQPACSAARASLLTGTYCNRFNFPYVLVPNSSEGFHENELTIAELVKQKNYATAHFGKWHVGGKAGALPLDQGFDEFYGIPWSADMWPYHPGGPWAPLPLYDNNNIIDNDVDSSLQEQFTTMWTEKTISFIDANKENPFLIYLAHNQPHVPLFASQDFQGTSGVGPYADVMLEIDWSVGQVMDALKQQGLENETLVMYTSDNGPWTLYGTHGGFTGPYRGYKAQSLEGGVHMPGIMWWPGQIHPGTVVDDPAMTTDFLPTMAHLMGGTLPDHPIDGRNITPLLLGQPMEPYPYMLYNGASLQGMRFGDYKLINQTTYRELETMVDDGRPGSWGASFTVAEGLYNIVDDPGETQNLKTSQSALYDSLTAIKNQYNQELQDNKRPVGQY